MTELERIADEAAETGEGPLWHPTAERLYWVDIPAGRLYQYDPIRDDNDLAYEAPDGSPLGGYTIEADGGLLLFGDGGHVSRWEPGGESVERVARIDADTRFNDVIADPEGRVFCGTMPGEDRLGDLYRLDPDGTSRVVVEAVDIPNGMGFSRDRETFYFTESEARRIYAFDYDQSTGRISNRRTFVETPRDEGVPDGMTVDANGRIWSARWNGARAVVYDRDGTALDELDVPARKVSSLAFGGPEYDDLYVTTALDGGDRSVQGEGAGALFRATDVDARGVPEYRSRIACE